MKTLITDTLIWLLIVAILAVAFWGLLEFTAWIRASGFETILGSIILIIGFLLCLKILVQGNNA